MSILKNILCSLLLLILITGCATTYAPGDWLPDKDDVPQNTSGGWITVVTEETDNQNAKTIMQYSGEFIALDDENVYLLYDSLYVISKKIILNSTLEIDQKKTGSYSIWVTSGSVLTISNGFIALYTFPLWMIAGVSTVSGESYRDRYEAEFPDEVYWKDINKFSRFPQGVEGINLPDIKPLYLESE